MKGVRLDHEWKIAKPGAACCSCQRPFVAPAEVGDEAPPVTDSYFSALFSAANGLARKDFCADCFREKRPADVYYFWKTAIAAGDAAAARKPAPVDVEYVLEFFKRLEGDGAPQRIAFRYILALMLTRKKVLAADGKSRDGAGIELQVFREKRGGLSHRVYAPELQADEIAVVTDELGALLGLKPAVRTPQPVLLPFEEGTGTGAAPEIAAATATGAPVGNTETDTTRGAT